MHLTELTKGTAIVMRLGAAEEKIEVRGLAADSRAVRPGFLFAALPGSRFDGRDFIADAVAKGAVAVLAPPGTELGQDDRQVALLTDDNPRRQLALLAARFYGGQPRQIAAVTGTNGKTSVAEFTRQLWQAQGLAAASLGTLGLVPPGPAAPSSLTTPDPIELHRCLAALAGEGVENLVLEASSHGLHQYRLDGVNVRAAAFTNLSRDHLDYHGDMADYLEAKLRLFEVLLEAGGWAVLNADVEEFETLANRCRSAGQRVLSYGTGGRELRLLSQAVSGVGQAIEIEAFGRRYRTRLPVAGSFQASNLLAALGLIFATGGDIEASLDAVSHLQGVPGRAEAVGTTPSGAQVFVDYAHTPDALETILRALRAHVEGRLFVVFGCGGDRDPGKRPMMGEIGSKLADVAIVTDDNPRSEDAGKIRREILAAVPEAREFGDRRRAIEWAIAQLASDDALVIAGKGHESGQIVGDRVLPFDDREVARNAITRLKRGGANAEER